MTIVVWWKKNMRDSTWKRSRISLKCCLLFNSCFLVTIVARTSLHNFPFGPPHGAVFVLHHGPGAFLHWNLLFFPNVFLFLSMKLWKLSGRLFHRLNSTIVCDVMRPTEKVNLKWRHFQILLSVFLLPFLHAPEPANSAREFNRSNIILAIQSTLMIFHSLHRAPIHVITRAAMSKSSQQMMKEMKNAKIICAKICCTAL